jgi:predicted naringenin-chalcone synthase
VSGVSGAIRFPDTRHLTPETKNSTTRLVNSKSGGYVHNPIELPNQSGATQMKRTVIRGTGRFLPQRVVTNEDMTQWMDTSDEWIQQRTGIQQRHWVPEEGGVGSSDLGLAASKIAMQRAGWKSEDLDLIIFATLSPDIFFPGPGCLMQHKLGLDATPALDIRQQGY